jgi:hypothetical protein
VPQARIREAEAVNRVPNLEAEEIAAIESAFKAGGVEFDREYNGVKMKAVR